jgi:hypothetical protein
MDWKALAQGSLKGPIKIATSGIQPSLFCIAVTEMMPVSMSDLIRLTRFLGADDASNFQEYPDDVEEGPGDKMGNIDRKDQVKAALLQSLRLDQNAFAEQ